MPVRICPIPKVWHRVHESLLAFTGAQECQPATPPKPLILAGWAYSSDADKKQRWADTVAWVEKNGCQDLVQGIPEGEFYLA